MMGNILPVIHDAADYRAAMAMLKVADAPPTADTTAAMAALYAKYLPEKISDDPATVRLCMAADLLLDQRDVEKDFFAAFGLPEEDLDGLLLLRELAVQETEMTPKQAEDIVKRVTADNLHPMLATALARGALDFMAGSRNYPELRDPILELADVLADNDMDSLELGSSMLRGAKLRCGRLM